MSLLDAGLLIKPPILSPQDTLAEAINLLQVESESACSCILVRDNDDWVGIVTRQDIFAHLLSGKDFKQKAIAEVMSYPLATMTSDEGDNLHLVQTFFAAGDKSYLPILNQDRSLKGVVTRTHFFEYLSTHPLDTATENVSENKDSLQELTQTLEEKVLSRTKALEESQNRLRLITDSVPAAIAYIDASERHQFANKTYRNWFDYLDDDLIGKTLLEVYGPEKYDNCHGYIQQVLAGEITTFEALSTYANGESRYVSGTLIPDFNEQQEVQGYYALATDLSDRHNIEQALKASEARYRDLIKAAPVGIFRHDTSGECLFVNQRACEISGLTLEEAQGDGWARALHPEDRDRIFYLWQKLLTDHVPLREEYRFLHPDGTVKWVYSQIILEYDDEGNAIGSIGSTTDISDRHATELALRDSETRWKFAIEGSGDGLWDWNLTSDKVFYSLQAIAMFGFEEQEITDDLLECDKRIHPEDKERVYQEVDKHFKGETQVYQSEYRLLCKDGTYKWILDRGKVMEWDADGKPLRMIGSITDISDRHAAELALQDSEARWKFAIEEAGDGLWDWDFTSGEIYCSPRIHAILGFDAQETKTVLADWDKLMHPEDFERVYQVLDEHLRGEAPIYQTEHRLLCKDGTYKWILDRGKVMEWDADGQPLRMIGTATDVTDRRAAEMALRDSEVRWKFALEGAGDGLWDWNIPSEKMFYSPQVKAMFGFEEKEITDDLSEWDSRIHPEDKERVYQDLDRHFRGEIQIYQNEHRVLCKDGSYKWMLSRGKVMEWDEDGQPLRMIGTATDMTERHAAEIALRESETRWKFAIEGSGDGLWDWNIASDEVFFSAQWKAMLGFEENEINNEVSEWEKRLHPEDKERVYQDLDRHFQGETLIYRNEHRVLCKDGSYKWILDRGKVMEWDVDGKPLRMIGTHKDISDRRAAEIALRDSEARWKFAIEGSGDGIWDWNITSDKVFFSSRWKEMLGFQEQEITDDFSEWDTRVHPEDKGRVYQNLDRHFQGETLVFQHEYRVLCKNGTYKWILDRGKVMEWDADGKPLRMIGTHTDISDRKEAELILQKTSDRLSLATEAAGIGLWEYDIINKRVIWDARQHEIYGVNPNDFQGTPEEWRDRLHPEDYPIILKNFETAIATDDTTALDSGTFRIVRPNGEIRYLKGSTTILRNQYQTPTRVIGVTLDVTSYKTTEQDLIQAKQIAESADQTKSLFLANMSHEIRTPMNGVIGMLDLLRDTPLSEHQLSQLNIAQGSAESLLHLIDDILDFSKVEADKLIIEAIEFDLHDLLSNLAKTIVLKAEEKGLEIILDLHDIGLQNTLVIGDPGRIRQVFANLLSNAVKFSDQGHINLTASLESTTTGLILTGVVADEGIGIPSDKLKVLFEPFTQADASTTRKYGGTGLGLTITKKLCELMGGELSVASTIHSGSEFRFSIPLQPGPKKQLSSAENLSGASVLVVDDNDQHRQILIQQLEVWDIQAHGVKSAGEAINLSAGQSRSQFDLAIINSVLSDMDAATFAKQLRQQHVQQKPTFSIVMMTTIGNYKVAQETHGKNIDGYLTKPIIPTELFELMTDLKATPQKQSSSQTTRRSKTVDKEPNSPWLRSPKLLLVEDNRVNQLVIQGLLKKIGLTADIATHGLEAIRILKKSTPDDPYQLILMDCLMPTMNGYEATAAIRQGDAGEDYRDIPIVALTANAMKGDREKCLEAGMSDYVSKPINSELLQKVLHHWLDSPEAPTP